MLDERELVLLQVVGLKAEEQEYKEDFRIL